VLLLHYPFLLLLHPIRTVVTLPIRVVVTPHSCCGYTRQQHPIRVVPIRVVVVVVNTTNSTVQYTETKTQKPTTKQHSSVGDNFDVERNRQTHKKRNNNTEKTTKTTCLYLLLFRK